MAGARFYLGNLADEGLSPMSGDKTYHLSQGPQDFFSRPNSTPLTPEQVQHSNQIIDQLLGTEPPPLGLEALKKSKDQLSAPKTH